jgi:hypothetical protein
MLKKGEFFSFFFPFFPFTTKMPLPLHFATRLCNVQRGKAIYYAQKIRASRQKLLQQAAAICNRALHITTR